MQHRNLPFIVIADDITGAAEIAGIGLKFGLRVNLIAYSGEENIVFPPECELLVFATDTRSMPEKMAIAITEQLANAIKATGKYPIFKKVDSALRGHILSELNVLMHTLHQHSAMLLPQNPSRGRIIKEGIYYINDSPLNKTTFACDPEFPATTADAKTLLKRKGIRCHNLAIEDTTIKEGIHLIEASTIQEVILRTEALDDFTLPAGGADFFTAYLTAKGYTVQNTPSFEGLGNNSAMIILGSTARHPIVEYPYIQRMQPFMCNTPPILFYRKPPRQWLEKISRRSSEHKSLVLYNNRSILKSREYAVNLREGMACTVGYILTKQTPQELIIEGGATAYAIFEVLGWKAFHVIAEVSPGVIRIVPTDRPDITVTLKPGSYTWGELFQ